MKCAGQYDMIKNNAFKPIGKGQIMETQKREAGKERQANLELLRIFSMLMIVMMHLLNHGKILETTARGSISYYLVWILFGISFVSISTYILISGYFLCETSFSFRRILKLEGQVWFYSVALYLASLLLLRQPFDMSSLIAAVFPVLSCEYWFVTMYVGMIVLSPFLNKLLTGLTQRQFRLLLVILFVLFSLWPNVFFFSPALNFGGGSGVVWFTTVYLSGAYLKRFYRPDGQFGRHLLHFFGAALLIPVSRFLIELLLSTPLGKIGFLQDLMWGYSIFYEYNSVLVFAAAILLFIAFLNLQIKPGRLQRMILAAAPLSFGVYLLHDNPQRKRLCLGNAESLPPGRSLVPGARRTAACRRCLRCLRIDRVAAQNDCLPASPPSEEKHSLPARILRTGLRRSG